ncbi:YheU family protein [Cellvibrio sp.]|uniref:YheU family protein n=1 Tax=Cellvibrio sp. TaxID=1965322 RepID=UPI00396476D8
MIIPHQQLSSEALQGLIEEFITREGTDYGAVEVSLAQKLDQVKRQLDRGNVVIVFDPASESVSILTKHDAKLMTSNE